MENGAENILGCILVAVIAFPVSLLMARGCLRGLMRIVAGGVNRDVL